MTTQFIEQHLFKRSVRFFLYILLLLILPSPSKAQYKITIEGQAYRLILAQDLIEKVQQAEAKTALEFKHLVVQGPFALNNDTLRIALSFEDLRFTDPVSFENAVLLQPVHFVRTHFQQTISLLGTELKGAFSCRDCRMVGNANFKRTSFAAPSDFSASHFASTAFFTQARFMEKSDFGQTRFDQAAYFDRALFDRSSNFQDASFTSIASFQSATWQSTISFAGGRFEKGVLFADTRFAEAATFDAAYFRREVEFSQADFSSTASFRRVVFAGLARFANTHFRAPTFFVDSRFKSEASFANTTFTHPFRPRADFAADPDLKDISAPLVDLKPKEENHPRQDAFLLSSDCGPETTPIQFVDITQAAGIDFEHYNGFTDEYYYVETFGAGAAFLDFDNDGWLDLYLVNGAPLKEKSLDPPPINRLYRNTTTGHFTDVTIASNTGHTGYGMGSAVADYDADGDVDLYITNFGPNLVLRNDDGERFSDVTVSTGGGDSRWGTSCGFLDYDLDGDLDLYITNYVDFKREKNIDCSEGGIRSYCEPQYYEPVRDVLYQNEGGKFVDTTLQVGITLAGRGLGVAFSDYDLDGDTDIYVANDGDMNFLYQNRGSHFAEVGITAGTRYNEDGLAEAGMGVEFGDWNNDGLQDIFVTNFAHQTNTLYGNDGQGQFYDITSRAGLAEPSYKPLGFGTNFFDYDNDGDLDLFVANGHVMDKIAQVNPDHSYPQPNQVFCNQQDARFVDVSTRLGPALMAAAVSRGSAVADYDNDGDPDLLVTNIAHTPNLLRNDGGNRQHWLAIELNGASQRDALGTRITVKTDNRHQIKERQSGGSYLSSSDPRLYFGLGKATQTDIEIRWPDGSMREIKGVEANQILPIFQND